MARISQDDDSWKAGGIKRRDFRHIKNGPEVPKHGKKKNTKKWCKGVPGREHDIHTVAWRGWFNTPSLTWVQDECKNCGKQFNFRKNPNL